jgi:hydrogenase expression/formation protein HypC
MCLAIPGKIVTIDRNFSGLKMAAVDFGGLTRKICVEWVDASVGDYVMAHAGMAISRVDTGEAELTLATFQDIARAAESENAAPPPRLADNAPHDNTARAIANDAGAITDSTHLGEDATGATATAKDTHATTTATRAPIGGASPAKNTSRPDEK